MKWNAALYDQKHSFVARYGEELVALIDLQPGERVLDVGSGTGHLTQMIADAGAEVVGIDSSSDMIAQAQAAHPSLSLVQADASDFAFAEPFDAIFSNATLHWVLRAEDAVACMARALKPGRRLVVEFGGKGNVARVTGALQTTVREILGEDFENRLYYPSIAEYATLLETHGLLVCSALLFDRPTPLDDGDEGLRNWIAMFGGRRIAELPDDTKQRLLKQVEDKLRPTQFVDGHWVVDYRRLRVVACKEH